MDELGWPYELWRCLHNRIVRVGWGIVSFDVLFEKFCTQFEILKFQYEEEQPIIKLQGIFYHIKLFATVAIRLFVINERNELFSNR